MKKYIYTIVISVTLLLQNVNSCKSQNTNVVSAKFNLIDSVIVRNTNSHTRSRFEPQKKCFQIYHKDSAGILLNGKYTPIKNPLGNEAVNFINIGTNIYLEEARKPNNLCFIIQDSIVHKKEITKIFKYLNEWYALQFFLGNTCVRLDSDEIIVPALYYENLDITTVNGFFKNANRNRLAHLKVKQDTLVLIKMINFFPRPNFFINEKRCLSFRPNLCSSKQNFYMVYDFLDSVFEYDKSGRFIKSIPLPKELNFFTYDNSYNLFIDPAQTEKAEMIGSKNTKILFDESTQHLLVVTVEGIHQNYNFKLIPSPNDWDWNISIFDLKTNKWLTIIKFDKYHEFRNVMFENGKIYVKRQTGKKLIFDVFTY